MKIFKRIVSLLLMLLLLGSCLSVTALAAETNPVYGIGFVTATGLYLRTEPNTASAYAATAQKDECVVILEQQGEWYKVNYDLQEGYMHSRFLQVSQVENAELGIGTVIGTGVNLRYGPGTEFGIAAIAPQGGECYILGLNQGWYKVIYNSDICYIRSDFLKLTQIPYENKGSEQQPKFFRLGQSTGVAPSAATLKNAAAAEVSVSAQAVVDRAKECLGAPYVYGGASLSGFDCSGLVYYVLKGLGMTPGRTPVEQFSMGTPVSKADLQAGDIVFFAGTAASGISHVGIYTGNGQFIHAPNSSSRVSYSDLTTGYWSEHYYGARHIAS